MNILSFPNIPNITPAISITTEQTIPLLLSSIALEELALAHIINAEAEKLQFVLGTLPTGTELSPAVVSLAELFAVDSSVQRTLRDVIKKEMLLEFKFENVLDLIGTLPCQPMIQMTSTEVTPCLFNNIGTVTCSGQLVSSPVTGTPLTFNVFLNGVLASQAFFDSPDGNFNFSVLLTQPFTGVLTITATATVNGKTVSTANSINVNCQPGVAGSGESITLMHPLEAAQITLDGGCDC